MQLRELFSKTDAAEYMIIFAYEDDWNTLKNGNSPGRARKV